MGCTLQDRLLWPRTPQRLQVTLFLWRFSAAEGIIFSHSDLPVSLFALVVSTIVMEKTEIDRHSVAAVGCSQFVKAPLRNDKRFWVLPPRDDCRAHVPAWNALFSEETARTRHFAQVDNTERKSTTAPLDFEDVHAVLEDVKFPRFFD